NGLVHKDIHSGNILINSKAKKANICDLGLTRPENSIDKKECGYGVLAYTAPEVLQHGRRTKASDIYAIGILIWEIIHGQGPFSDYTYNCCKYLAIIDGERPEFTVNCHRLLYYFAKWCWNENPQFLCDLCELSLEPSSPPSPPPSSTPSSFDIDLGTGDSDNFYELSYKTSSHDDDERLSLNCLIKLRLHLNDYPLDSLLMMCLSNQI
ncbi:7829_t:CDS:1, partial [Ambispora gerdemannii]